MYMNARAVCCGIRKGADYRGWFRVLGTEKFRANPSDGALFFPSLLSKTVSGQWGWGASLHPSCTLRSSMRRASPVNTSSHQLSGGGCFRWTGYGPGVRARPPVYPLRYGLQGDYSKESDGIRGRACAPHQSEHLKFYVVLVGVQQFI